MKAEVQVDALFDNLAAVEGETLIYTLVKVKTEALIHAVADMLQEVGPETLSNKLAEVKSKTRLDNLADWPVELQTETRETIQRSMHYCILWLIGHQWWTARQPKQTLADVRAETVLHALPNTLSDDNGQTLSDTFADVTAETLVDTLPDKLEKTRLTHRTRHWAT